MHGLLFKSMKDFVVENRDEETWDEICEAADVDKRIFLTIDTYPDAELIRIFDAAADQVGRSVPELLESYGRFAAGQLLSTHRDVVADDWDALDLLANADEQIIDVLRARDPDLDLPKLVCRRDDDAQVTVEYRSERRLCAVAKGIVRGIGDHYDARLAVTERSCMHDGAEHCELVVER